MSYYPRHTLFINRSKKTIHHVSIDSYRQALSSGGFINLMLKTPYHIAHVSKKVRNYTPWKCCYSNMHIHDYETRTPAACMMTEGFEHIHNLNLYEFYDAIGYDRATKKLEGKTLTKYILDYCKANPPR